MRAAKQVPLGCIAPHTAQRCHSEPVTDVTAVARPTFLCCHSEPVTDVTGVGIRSPRPQARNPIPQGTPPSMSRP